MRRAYGRVRTEWFGLVAVGLLVVSAFGADPAPPDNDAKAVEAVRKAAETAEVHAVGVCDPPESGFWSADVTDWPQFVDQLRRGEGAAGRVWEVLPEKTRGYVRDDAVVAQLLAGKPAADVTRLTGNVASGIRMYLHRADFYTAPAFKDVPLDDELKRLVALGEKRTHLETLGMNRALLAAAFPNAVRAAPAHWHTVTVRVKAGSPVVLALTAYTACRWVVEVEDGGSVGGVVLGGHESQELFGVKAPVVCRAGYDAYRRPRRGDKIWQCYDEKDEKQYAQFKSGVKAVTGKELTAFQGAYTAPKSGFTIQPGAK